MTVNYESHGLDLSWVGWMSALYGLISFFVAPVLGRVSDSHGRVTMLKVSALGSLLGSLGGLYAQEKWTFMASRTLPGLLKCSIPISQAYVVDVSKTNTQRSNNLGMLGASFGMAFVIGPPIGGLAMDYHPSLPLLLSAILCGLLQGVLLFLPEPVASTSKEGGGKGVERNGNGKGKGKGTEKEGGGEGSWREIFKGPGGREVAWGLHDRLALVVVETLHQLTFPVVLAKVLGFSGSQVGLLLSFKGIISAATNAFLVGELTQRFPEGMLMVGGLLALAGGWTMWASVRRLPHILVALAIVTIGSSIFQTVNRARMAQYAPPHLVGTFMGMQGALETFCRAAGGSLSGYLFAKWGGGGLSLACAGMAMYVALVMSLRGLERGGTGAGEESKMKVQ